MNGPTLTMVGHAGVVLDIGPSVVWTDPWLRSRAFNDGWAIHPEPVLTDESLARITHIWISHEHPDHFNVPTLRGLPDEVRSRVDVLIQEHPRREVAAFLRDTGFRVTEMSAGRPLSIPGGTLTCHPVGHEDSALVVEAAGLTVLDLNDCKPGDGELRRMLRHHGDVDVLLDQFSGAGWNGNPDDAGRKRRQARLVRDTFDRHLEVIDPRWVVPFASFVRFCHTENTHLAQERVTLDEVVDAHPDRAFAVLYPGDSWQLDGPWERTDVARKRYRTADEDLAHLPLVTSEPVPISEVVDAARQLVERLQAAFHAPVCRRVPPVRFVISDGDGPELRLTVSLTDGVRFDDDAAATDVHLGSQAAWNTFSQPWGLSTLLISGRFSIDGPEGPFLRLKQLNAAAVAGYRTRGVRTLITDRRARAMVGRTLRLMLRRPRPRGRESHRSP